MNNPIDQFIKGQQDCRDGLPAQAQDEAYISGYGFQYRMAQIIEENQNGKNALQKGL